VRVKKERQLPKAQDVPRNFSDHRIWELAAEAKLPIGDELRFAAGVREAVLIYISEASAASDNGVQQEVHALLRAADRAVTARKNKDAACEDVAKRIERLSERARERLKDRSTRAAALEMPNPEAFRDIAQRVEACEAIARLCRVGACWEEGRLRPGGKRSITMASTLHAPELQQHPARREAELNFVMWLRLAYIEATGKRPSPTANPARPGPFARMVQLCLDKIQASANAVELLKELQRRSKGKKQDYQPSDQGIQDITPCQVKTPKHRPG